MVLGKGGQCRGGSWNLPIKSSIDQQTQNMLYSEVFEIDQYTMYLATMRRLND